MHRTSVMSAGLFCVVCCAQTPASKPEFEAASLTRNADSIVKAEPQAAAGFSPGGVTMRNASVAELILAAYNIHDYQLTAPGWMRADRYELTAKAAPGATTEQMRAMLQTLLEERFRMTVHRETKEFAVEALVVGRNAPKIGPREPEGTKKLAVHDGNLIFQNYTLADLAEYLSRTSQRPIVDATGIEGRYDLAVSMAEGGAVEVKQAMEQVMRDGTMAQVIGERLGLKLEARKTPQTAIVVDRAERKAVEN